MSNLSVHNSTTKSPRLDEPVIVYLNNSGQFYYKIFEFKDLKTEKNYFNNAIFKYVLFNDFSFNVTTNAPPEATQIYKKNKINNCDSYPKFRLKSLFYVLGASH